MSERRLPIDPESIRFIDNPLGGKIYALGRDDLEGRVLVYNGNAYSNKLSEVSARFAELGNNSVVVGPGIDLSRSRAKKSQVFDHQRLGIWHYENDPEIVAKVVTNE